MSDEVLLAIETSSPHGSVALGRGDALLAHRRLTTVRRHTGELLPAIDELLREIGQTPGDVGVLCFSRGPGSFTGLRVAATIASTWQFAAGCRVVGVPSLAVIAANAWAVDSPPERAVVLLDARQGKVFGAVFERDGSPGGRECVPAALHVASEWLPSLPIPCAALGDGVAVYRELLETAGVRVLPEELGVPDARHVLTIGREMAERGTFLSPEAIVPDYLRPPECEEVYEKRRAAARERRGE